MTTNNTYLKTIAEKVTETEISGTHTDNYYLKLICTTYGYTYTGTVCDGKLIKDFASAVTSKTYNRIHFDNKYYHDIAESLTGNTYDNKYDNFYLGIIAENITPPTPLKKLDHINVELIAGNQILSYADEQQTQGSQYATVRFTAYADAGETETIPNLSLDFKVGSGVVTSVVTDSNGRYEYTYHSQGVGDVEIVASKTVEGILVSKTYSIEDCVRYNPNEYNSSTTVDYSLPSAFKCSFIIIPTSRNSSTSALTVSTSNGTIYIGQYSSHGTNGIYTSSGQSTGTVSILNTEQECVWEYSNGVHTFTLNGHTVTVNGYAPNTITTLGASSNNHLKQLKVKPL